MSFETKNNKLIKNNFSSILNLFKIHPIKFTQTKFGEGFHYHNLKIKKDKKWYFFDEYIKIFFNKKIICIDSSVEKDINPGPFTITQMAVAYKKLKKNTF